MKKLSSLLKLIIKQNGFLFSYSPISFFSFRIYKPNCIKQKLKPQKMEQFSRPGYRPFESVSTLNLRFFYAMRQDWKQLAPEAGQKSKRKITYKQKISHQSTLEKKIVFVLNSGSDGIRLGVPCCRNRLGWGGHPSRNEFARSDHSSFPFSAWRIMALQGSPPTQFIAGDNSHDSAASEVGLKPSARRLHSAASSWYMAHVQKGP